MATTMKKFTFTIWDTLVLCVLASLAWGKSAQTILLAVIAYLLYLLVRSQLSRHADTPIISADDNEFLVDDDGLCPRQLIWIQTSIIDRGRIIFDSTRGLTLYPGTRNTNTRLMAQKSPFACCMSRWKTLGFPKCGKCVMGYCWKRSFGND